MQICANNSREVSINFFSVYLLTQLGKQFDSARCNISYHSYIKVSKIL